MSVLQRKVLGARRRLARRVDPSLAEWRKIVAAAFYDQSPSCEIPNLWFLYATFLGERSQGCFVEIGAYDGLTASNTWGLARTGWSGLMVEPVDAHFRLCQRNHRSHPKVTVVRKAIGAPGENSIRLELAKTLTTANMDLADSYRNIDWAHRNMTGLFVDVPSVSLDELLTLQGVEASFDVLSVDVEGFESQVFSGFDLAKWHPRMLIVELVDTHPDLSVAGKSDAVLSRKISEAGYVIVFKDRVNTVFVREDDWISVFG